MNVETRVENIWSNFAKSYDEVIPKLDCYNVMFQKIMSHTQNANICIDAGCGTGIISQAWVNQGKTVFGFDNNPGMLGLAFEKNSKLPKELAQKWQITYGDVRKFPEEAPHNADAIVMNNVLFYVPEPEVAILEAYNHLAPGGVLVCTGPKSRPNPVLVFDEEVAGFKRKNIYTTELQNSIAHFFECSKKLTSQEMVTFFEPTALADTLLRLGFSEILEATGNDYYGLNHFVVARK